MWSVWFIYDCCFQDLRQYPVKIGVISNWDDRLHKVLEAMKLRPYFDFVLTSTVVGVEKPDSAIFQLALQVGSNCHLFPWDPLFLPHLLHEHKGSLLFVG